MGKADRFIKEDDVWKVTITPSFQKSALLGGFDFSLGNTFSLYGTEKPKIIDLHWEPADGSMYGIQRVWFQGSLGREVPVPGIR